MGEEIITRQMLINMGASEGCAGLKEAMDWLFGHCAHTIADMDRGWDRHAHHSSEGPYRESRFRLSDVVPSLEKFRPKFGGVDGLDWLLVHDVRTWAHLSPQGQRCHRTFAERQTPPPPEPAPVFDPKELKVGDEFDRNAAPRLTVLYVDPWAAVLKWSHIKAPLFIQHTDWEHDPITRVSRPDASGKLVQIWPRPACKFRPGQEVVGYCHRDTVDHVEWIADACGGPYWLVVTTGGYRVPESQCQLAPADDFQPGDEVAYHGSHFRFGRYHDNRDYAILNTLGGAHDFQSIPICDLTLISRAGAKV